MLEPIRLNRFLAERLGVSRRQADDLIATGKVFVDRQKAVLGARITPDREVLIKAHGLTTEVAEKVKRLKTTNDGYCVAPQAVNYLYVAMNKPVGYVCSRRSQDDAPTIYELLPTEYRSLKTVGRLDKDSSGLILLTNDGDFAFQMTHPKFAKYKLYEVELDRPLEPMHQQMIADFGINLNDGRSQLGLTCQDETRKRWQVTMHEGRNRQIRRTFGALNYTVIKLNRLEFGKFSLGNLKPGDWEVLDLKCKTTDN